MHVANLDVIKDALAGLDLLPARLTQGPEADRVWANLGV